MSHRAIEVSRLYKKFRKGTTHDSLRDLIPASVARLFHRKTEEDLKENEFWALKDISFHVEKGEAFGIIGNNGAGKSTMLKLLTGILKPTSGNITVKGRLSALIEVGAGFHPDLTGRENIFLNGSILGMTRREIRNKFDEIVEFSGLSEFIDTPVKRYSSGMYARLGFSVCAHVDPDILVVDEVLSVGDMAFQGKCQKKMDAVIRGGATVVYVSHNLKSVIDICNRVVLIEKGDILCEGAAQEVVNRYLNRYSEGHRESDDKEVKITSVSVKKDGEESIRFESGDKITIDIDIEAIKKCNRFSVTLFMNDGRYYNVFNTSTERLDGTVFSLDEGEKLRCSYELTLNLAQGGYHIGVHLYQYEIERMYDQLYPAKTIYIYSSEDVGGVVNLFPKSYFKQFERN
jgi:lipopolysaccharide transport system ATP-binding protein